MSGNGLCSLCYSGYIGENCSQNCTCKYGSCDSNGQCAYCFGSYFGTYCDLLCVCGNGTCNYDTAKNNFTGCICNDGYLSDLADPWICHSCADQNICSYGGYVVTGGSLGFSKTQIGNLLVSSTNLSLSSTQTSDLNIVGSTVSIVNGSYVYIGGNLDSESSSLDLQQSSIYVDGNAYFYDTVLKYSSQSNITVNGCLNLNNITFDLTSISSTDKSQNITVLTFASNNCSNVLTNIKIMSDDSTDCPKISAIPMIYKDSVVIAIQKDLSSQCSTTTSNQDNSFGPLPFWGFIALVCLGGLLFFVVIFLVIGMCVPSCSRRLLPFRGVEDRLTDEFSEKPDDINNRL